MVDLRTAELIMICGLTAHSFNDKGKILSSLQQQSRETHLRLFNTQPNINNLNMGKRGCLGRPNLPIGGLDWMESKFK